MEKHIELVYLLDYYGNLLTNRQQSIMEQQLYEDCSLSEIAQREGISRQGVRDTLVKAQEQLYHYEEKLGLVKSALEEKKILESIVRKVENSSAAQKDKEEIISEIKRLGVFNEE